MQRLAMIPLGMTVGYLSLNYHLTYFSFGILIGLSIIFVDYLHGKEHTSDPQFGYISVLVGIALLATTFFITNSYGITFEELDQDKNFSKFARYLPVFSVTFLTMGVFGVIKSISGR